MLERAILFGLPALCGVMMIVAFVGPGAERRVVAARAYGLPYAGAERFALRVASVAHHDGLVRPEPGRLRVEIVAEGGVVGSWEGQTDAGGWAEAKGALSRAAERFELRVLRSDRVVARGSWAAGETLPVRAHEPPAAAGELPAIASWLPRGFAVPEIPERLDVLVIAPPGEGKPPAVEVTAAGADLGAPTLLAESGCDGRECRYRSWLEVTARAPNPEIEITARAGEVTRSGRCALRLRPGGIWVDPGSLAARVLELRAATPKPYAYVSLAGVQGRIWGAIVPLAEGEGGTSHGRVALPELEPGPWVALVSSEPEEPEARTAPWPLAPELGVVDAPALAVVADGLPEAIAGEQRRIRRVRLPLVGLIAAAGCAVLLQIASSNRAARRELERRLALAGAEPALMQPKRRVARAAWVVIAAGVLALAFAVMAGFAAFV